MKRARESHSTSGKKKSGSGKAKKVTKVSKEVAAAVKAVVHAEAKKNAGYVDLAYATYNMDTTGSIALVATIAQGAGVQQRIGKKASYKSVQVRGLCHSNTATTVADGAILLVYDREPTGALPAITAILNTATSQSFLNDDNSKRFRIMRRWDYTYCGPVGTPTSASAYSMDEWVDMKNLPVQFKAAATGAIGDIATGALYVVTVGNIAAGTAAPVANIGFRTRFVDEQG